MERLDELRRMINDDLIEAKLILQETNPKELFSKIEEVLSLSRTKDKIKLTTIDNFTIFTIFLNAANSNVFTYQETMELCSEAKSEINNWTYNNTKNEFKVLFEKTDDINGLNSNYIDTFYKLGLPSPLLEYDLKGLYLTMNRFLEYKERIKQINEKNNVLILNKNVQMTPSQRIKRCEEVFYECQIDKLLGLLQNYVNNNEKELQYRKKIARTKIKLYEEILKKFDDGSIKEMIDEIPEEWCIYLNPTIASEILLVILSNQTVEYKTEETMINISKKIIEKTPLTKYLYEHGYNPNEIENLEELENNQETISNIEFILKLGIKDINKYKNIILSLNKEIKNNITKLLNEKVLSKETIINNISSLDNLYNRLLLNYDILKNNLNIDFNNKYYNDNILFIDSNTLRNIISVLKEYNISNDIYIFLLCNYQYISIYDLMIENNIPEELFIQICSNINPINIIKRILIYKQIDIPYLTEKGLLKRELLSENRFPIYDEELDNYLGNVVTSTIYEPITGNNITNVTELLIVKILDSNNKNNNVYQFNDTKVSRPKFLKNLQQVIDLRKDVRQLLLPILASNSIYNEKDLFELTKTTKSYLR